MLAPLWSELTSWLVVNAPRTLDYVRPPGDPARLASAEERLGFALTDELTEWWQLHDGLVAGYLVPSYELFSFDHMLFTHEMERRLNLEEEVRASRGLEARYFPSRYVPIGDTGANNYLVVDCRPGRGYGFLRDHDHEDRGVVKPAYYTSLTDLLTRMVTALRTGQPMEVGTADRHFPATPVVEDGMLSWE